MYVLEDHAFHVLAFPLWGHVSDTVHSQEGEILGELDEVSGDLAIGGPCCPLFGSRPLKGFDPAAGADSGDNAISVT
mgnify:CR=1 FL=1